MLTALWNPHTDMLTCIQAHSSMVEREVNSLEVFGSSPNELTKSAEHVDSVGSIVRSASPQSPLSSAYCGAYMVKARSFKSEQVVQIHTQRRVEKNSTASPHCSTVITVGRRVEQWLARQAHNLEVVGSNPTSATNRAVRTEDHELRRSPVTGDPSRVSHLRTRGPLLELHTVLVTRLSSGRSWVRVPISGDKLEIAQLVRAPKIPGVTLQFQLRSCLCIARGYTLCAKKLPYYPDNSTGDFSLRSMLEAWRNGRRGRPRIDLRVASEMTRRHNAGSTPAASTTLTAYREGRA